MTDQPVILAEDSDTRLVQLDASYGLDGCRDTTILHVLLAADQYAEFQRMGILRESTLFRISAEQADAFVLAWAAFKADMEANAERAQTEEDARINEALKLAKSVPGLVIKGEVGQWIVAMEKPYVHRYAYRGEELLQAVQFAAKLYEQATLPAPPIIEKRLTLPTLPNE